MKGLITTLTMLLALSTIGQNAYLKYPDYALIVSKFFSSYSIKDIPPTAEIGFEKRPTGWHVAVIDYSEEKKTIKNELYWNKEKANFQNLAFEKLEDKDQNQNELKRYIEDASTRYYRICPYFGYPGWHLDVIEEYENISNLPDSTLFALGNAYSRCASDLLNDDRGTSTAQHQFQLPPGKNCLSDQQLEKYRYYSHNAIEKFRQLAELNPKYETIVGTIYLKLSNEYLSSFLDLRIYQNEEEAKKELIEGLYSEFQISTAKNYLTTCSSNAILFTNGDNDTFPLLYVQSQYGFRTDVMVVNLSLLNTERYINSLRDTILDAPGLPISLTPEEISGRKREVILIEAEDNEPRELSALIALLKNDEHVIKYGNTNYNYVPSNKFSLKQQENSIEWQVDRRYFYRNHLMVLDILANNAWVRPVYFGYAIGHDTYFGLGDYFQLEGIAYRLSTSKKKENDLNTGQVNTTILFDNLMEKFDWSGIKSANSHEKLVCMNYRNTFHQLAEELIKENKFDSALYALNFCLELMPNEILYYDYSMIPLMEDYYKINEIDKANQIANKIIHNLKNDLSNFSDIKILTRPEFEEATIQKLKDLFELYGQDELLREIEK